MTTRTMAQTDRLTLDVIVDDPAWKTMGAALEVAVRRVVEAGLDGAGMADPVELCVLLTGDARQQALNTEHRGKDEPTNVLSFPQHEKAPPDAPRHLGDISIAYGVVAAEAERDAKDLTDHTTHLALHGLFHLLGYDHEDAAAAIEMEALEVAALARLGIADPYQVTHNSTGGSCAAC